MPSTNMVPSRVGLLHSGHASWFGEVGSVPSAAVSSSMYLLSLPRSQGYKQPFMYMGNWCLPISPRIEFDSVFILGFSCVTEERELETSFEGRAVSWLRRRPGEQEEQRVWIQLWSYKGVTLSKLFNIFRPQSAPV